MTVNDIIEQFPSLEIATLQTIIDAAQAEIESRPDYGVPWDYTFDPHICELASG